MPTRTLLENVRRRLWCYLDQSVAACAGMSLEQLQQTISAVYTPTAAQTDALARRLQLMPYQYPETASS